MNGYKVSRVSAGKKQESKKLAVQVNGRLL